MDPPSGMFAELVVLQQLMNLIWINKNTSRAMRLEEGSALPKEKDPMRTWLREMRTYYAKAVCKITKMLPDSSKNECWTTYAMTTIVEAYTGYMQEHNFPLKWFLNKNNLLVPLNDEQASHSWESDGLAERRMVKLANQNNELWKDFMMFTPSQKSKWVQELYALAVMQALAWNAQDGFISSLQWLLQHAQDASGMLSF